MQDLVLNGGTKRDSDLSCNIKFAVAQAGLKTSSSPITAVEKHFFVYLNFLQYNILSYCTNILNNLVIIHLKGFTDIVYLP